MQRIGFFIALVALAALVAGCATGFSNKAIQSVNPDIKISDLFDDPYGIEGETVLFGGKIMTLSSYAGESTMEVQHFPLDPKLVPDTAGKSEGLIIVRFKTFLQKDIYRPGRLMTIIGRVKGTETKKKFAPRDLVFPVVEAIEYQLRPPSESIITPTVTPLPIP